jgi:hypothetical protein
MSLLFGRLDIISFSAMPDAIPSVDTLSVPSLYHLSIFAATSDVILDTLGVPFLFSVSFLSSL